MYLNQIYRHARDYPDSLAVVDSGKEVTYLEFARIIDAVRSFLMESRLPPDSLIVNLKDNLFRNWVLLLALRSLGHTTVSARTVETLEELRLRDIGALVYFTAGAGEIGAFARALPDCPIVKIPLPLRTDLKAGTSPELIDGGRFGDHILYSTGTTGFHKKVRYEGHLLERCVADPLTGPTARLISRDDVYHATNYGPWCKPGFIHPLVCWYRGATVIFEERDDWTEHFFDYPLTMATLVPPMLHRLCKSGASPPPGYPKFRLLAGGGFIDAELALEAIRRFGCEFLVVYGSTETRIAMESLVLVKDDVVWLTPNPEEDVEVVDENDQPVRTGEEGIVRIKFSSSFPTEYMDDPEATAQHFRNGYFYPGDMAVKRSDGRMRILGRVADVLNLGGQKIAVETFEEQVRELLQVDNLCAFVQQDDKGNQKLFVVIEGDRLPDQTLLQAVANGLVHNVPLVSFLLTNKLPRSDNGMMKINRHEVQTFVRETIAKQKQPVVS